MSHLDPSSLAQYNSLVDPNLQSYFSNERIRSHLRHAGLITGQGEVVPESEYRTRLARLEHRKHVRHVLAENIVSRAIDMERQRQAEMRKQFDSVAKAALVNSIKESRRRSGNLTGFMTNSMDLDLLPIDSNWSQSRPKTANYQNEFYSDDQTRVPRLHSAHFNGKQHSSKSRHRRRSKIRSSSTKNNRLLKQMEKSSRPAKITMVYYGPKIQVDYDHLVFEPVDEIIVMQQHCGGENIIVYKENLRPGAEFTFDSRRHLDYPFGLTLYVKGFIDSRISTCCEYKHRHGVRLGGDRGHFAIKSVEGSKPCIKCRFEKQARLKKYADSPKDQKKSNQQAITISLPVTDEPKRNETPVKIPVQQRTSISNKITYEDDFDGSDRQKHSIKDDYSTDSTIEKKSSRKKRDSSSSNDEINRKKTWQINFYSKNFSQEKNLFIQFSLLSNNRKDQTEFHEINFEKFNQNSKTNFNSFSVQLKNIGKPEEIKLKMKKTNENDDDDDLIKWNLDFIELIDPENQTRIKFPCNQTIRLFQEKFLQISKRKDSTTSQTSTESQSDRTQEIKVRYRVIIYPSSSSDGNFQPTDKTRLFIRLNNQNQEIDLNENICPRFFPGKKQTFEREFHLNNNDKPNKLTFGYFNPNLTAKIWKLKKIILINLQTEEKFVFICKEILRRNDQTNKAERTFLIQSNQSDSERSTSKKTSSDEEQKRRSPSISNSDKKEKQPKSITKLSSFRSDTDEQQTDRTQKSTNKQKSISIQSESDDQKSPIVQNEKQKDQTQIKQRSPSIQSQNDDKQTNRSNKEKSFEKQESDDENRTPRNQSSDKFEEQLSLNQNQNIDDKQRSPSFQSMNDDEANYREIFKKLDPDNELKLGSRPSTPVQRPKTRRGKQDHQDISPVEPLEGLNDLQEQTARSNDQINIQSFPSTATSKRQQPQSDEDHFNN